MPHKHPPICCCLGGPYFDGRTPSPEMICPSCCDHGELAQLADNECPSCHQLPGRPPTDYCRQLNWHVRPDSVDLVGHLRASVDAARATRKGLDQLDGPKTLTTQLATRTTTPPTQTRDTPPGHGWHQDDEHSAHERWRCRPDRCGLEPTPLATPTPPQCPSCGRYLTDPPGHRCRAADRHTHLE